MDEAQKWFSEGVALYEKEDYRRAIAAFDKAIAMDPTVAEIWNNRGLALIQTEQYQEALKSINKALSLHPGYDNARKAKKIVLDLINEPEHADTAPGPAGSPAPKDPVAPERKPSKTFTVAVIVIMIIAVGGLLVVKNMQNPAGTFLHAAPTTEPTTIPTPVPTAVETPVPTPTLPVVPPSGIWVEIIYDQYYSGTVGTPGNQQMVAGSQQVMPNTGDHFYRIPAANDGLVTASIQKNDGSGDQLTVKIYKDGTLVKTDSTTLPNGNLDVVATIPASVATSMAGNTTGNVTDQAPAGA
ncbi:MAG: tetratricopeptide repeat protein [Methanoregula sp.]|uniref:tetratricopeptide repeat protein n=1 Tax=Methanoregula sp. TaxID=2052170 RepID=UPI003C71A681